MFQAMRLASITFSKVRVDALSKTSSVHVDRSQIASVGRPALRKLLMRLHIYRSTADAPRCRVLMKELTEPPLECLEWRQILSQEETMKRVFVQPNTFLDGDAVVLKDYEASSQGMIKSWAEREV
jgi:dipeptidyl-peptidase-3